MARITGSDKEFLNQLGVIAASKMSKEAAEQIAKDLEDAKQYANELKQRVVEEVKESEQLRDKNRREAHRLLADVTRQSDERQSRLNNQKKQLSLDRSNLNELEARLAAKARALEAEKKAIEASRIEAAQLLSQATTMQARNAEILDELKARLERTKELWQRSM